MASSSFRLYFALPDLEFLLIGNALLQDPIDTPRLGSLALFLVVHIDVLFSSLIFLTVVVVLSDHFSSNLSQTFFRAANLLLTLFLSHHILKTPPFLVSTLVFRPLPHNELIELIDKLLVA